MGEFSHEEADRLAKYCEEKFGLKISVLKQIPIQSEAMDQDRNQAVAERLVATIRSSLPGLAQDPKAILIGLTSIDIYPASMNWQFAFGWRIPEVRAAVVSTARMNLHYDGEPRSGTDEQSRLRKVVLKDVGILYFGLPQSSNPQSVLYSHILGIQELDAVGYDF